MQLSDSTSPSSSCCSLASSHCSSPSSSSSLSGATAIPIQLLPLICRHLSVADLLRLLRCCSALRRLPLDSTSFNAAVAWSSAPLTLRLCRLLDWALPSGDCMDGDRIPLSVWQQALPAMQYTVGQWPPWCRYEGGGCDKVAMSAMRAAANNEQPTTAVRVGEQECAVLSRLTRRALDKSFPCGVRASCYRHLFVVGAVPHLQHLHLIIDPHDITPPPASEMFSLVPHLRSLHLEQLKRIDTHPAPSVMPIRATLALLPQLTALHCTALRLSMEDLIDMAAHPTVEHIRLQRIVPHWHDLELLRAHKRDRRSAYDFEFDSADSIHSFLKHPLKRAAAAAATTAASDTSRAGATFYRNGQHVSCAEDNRLLHSALTHGQPSQRSITARLALANFLHQRTQHCRSKDVLSLESVQHFRHQIAVLRSTLHRQLLCSTSETAEE